MKLDSDKRTSLLTVVLITTVKSFRVPTPSVPFNNLRLSIDKTSYDHLTTILRPSYDHLTTILRPSYEHLTI